MMIHAHQHPRDFIANAWKQQRLPHALLLVGPSEVEISTFVAHSAQMILCKSLQGPPCGTCTDCIMLQEEQHPDFLWIKANKKGLSIKIDQIRELQQDAYLSPQRGNYRVIIIEAMDCMNIAATNALLKILEEPPGHTIFMLLAQQISTILPTITSRCQILNFASHKLYSLDLNELAQQFPPTSSRVDLLNKREIIYSSLINLMERKIHPCVLAAQWSEFELVDMLWFLYLIFAQIQFHLVAPKLIQLPEELFFSRFITLIQTKTLILLIEKIESIIKKLYRNVPLNSTLILENLLIELQSTVE